MSFQHYLKVVICFSILTDLTKFLLNFCGWSVRRTRSYWCEKNKERQEFKLGDAQGTPSKYSRRLKRLSLGMPRKASPLSSKNQYVFGFVSFMWYVQILETLLHLVFIFLLWTMLVWGSLGWYIEFSMHFTYIFWVWLYRMLHVLHLYHLKFALHVPLHLDNRHL